MQGLANLVKTDLVINDSHDYYCLIGLNDWRVVNSTRLRSFLGSAFTDKPRTFPVMSLRLSTGLMGELDCPAGNRGPKGANEVVIGIGDEGINGLLDPGGLPCYVCNSGSRLKRMDRSTVDLLRHNVETLENSIDNKWLKNHYDARRLNWQEITKLNISPSRFYTRPDLRKDEVIEIVNIFRSKSLKVPTIGYYNASEHFTEY